jgi:hypothetical protein
MPFQTGQTCVDTALQAAQYQASVNVGSIVQIGTAQYVTSVVSVSATSIAYRFTNVSSTAVVNKTIVPSPQPCANLSSADFLQMSWLVAAAWVAAACFKLLYKMAFSVNEGSENVS